MLSFGVGVTIAARVPQVLEVALPLALLVTGPSCPHCELLLCCRGKYIDGTQELYRYPLLNPAFVAISSEIPKFRFRCAKYKYR